MPNKVTHVTVIYEKIGYDTSIEYSTGRGDQYMKMGDQYMKRKILFAGSILVMLITVTGCSLARSGQMAGPGPEQNNVLIQHESATTLHQSATTLHQGENSLKANMEAMSFEAPVDLIPIPEDTQREIWKLSQENRLAYELVLAILQTDGRYSTRMDEVKAVVEELASYRDYWAERGYPDERVFDLLILSAQRGLEGSQSFIANNSAYEQDDYVQKVTEYKYYLDQNQNTDDAMMTKL